MFAWFRLNGTVPYLELAHRKINIESLLEAHPAITLSKMSTQTNRRGQKVWTNPHWDWIDVPLASSLPEPFLIELIEHS
jgi:hypothetical protein